MSLSLVVLQHALSNTMEHKSSLLSEILSESIGILFIPLFYSIQNIESLLESYLQPNSSLCCVIYLSCDFAQFHTETFQKREDIGDKPEESTVCFESARHFSDTIHATHIGIASLKTLK